MVNINHLPAVIPWNKKFIDDCNIPQKVMDRPFERMVTFKSKRDCQQLLHPTLQGKGHQYCRIKRHKSRKMAYFPSSRQVILFTKLVPPVAITHLFENGKITEECHLFIGQEASTVDIKRPFCRKSAASVIF